MYHMYNEIINNRFLYGPQCQKNLQFEGPWHAWASLSIYINWVHLERNPAILRHILIYNVHVAYGNNLIQQSLPSADPLTGGHLPWADIFPMYKLLSNLIQPLMNGHLLNADRDSA